MTDPDGVQRGPQGRRGPARPVRIPPTLALGGRVLAAALSLTIVVVGGFYWATYRNFTTTITRVDAIPDKKSGPATDIDGEAQNILIAGNDDRSTASPSELAELGTTEDGGSLNTDTMMVLHVPADGSKAFVISFPRDSYVDIPGNGTRRLNAAFAFGYNSVQGDAKNKAVHDQKVGAGARLLIQTIDNLTGITIDHFVMVDLISFYRISNAIGGVPVCLNAPAKDSYSGIDLKAGLSVIKGKQALAFVRQRHGLPRSDLDRIQRQQYFLSQTLRTITGRGVLTNPIKLTRLLKAISTSLTLDRDDPRSGHTGLDPLKLAQQMQNLTAGKLTFATIPTQEAMIDGNDVLQVDRATVGAFVKRALGLLPAPKPDTAYAKAKTVDPSTVTVDVLNGSGVGGAAGTSSQTLSQAGFVTGRPGDAPASVSATAITYPAGQESQAKTVAQYVPGATVVRSTSVQRVTLTLGTDGTVARSTPATTAPTAAPTSSATPSGGASTTPAIPGGCVN